MTADQPTIKVHRFPRSADTQHELLRRVGHAASQQIERMIREHFADTPLYIETAVQTGVMPARVRIIEGQREWSDDPRVFGVTHRTTLVEDRLPPFNPPLSLDSLRVAWPA